MSLEYTDYGSIKNQDLIQKPSFFIKKVKSIKSKISNFVEDFILKIRPTADRLIRKENKLLEKKYKLINKINDLKRSVEICSESGIEIKKLKIDNTKLRMLNGKLKHDIDNNNKEIKEKKSKGYEIFDLKENEELREKIDENNQKIKNNQILIEINEINISNEHNKEKVVILIEKNTEKLNENESDILKISRMKEEFGFINQNVVNLEIKKTKNGIKNLNECLKKYKESKSEAVIEMRNNKNELINDFIKKKESVESSINELREYYKKISEMCDIHNKSKKDVNELIDDINKLENILKFIDAKLQLEHYSKMLQQKQFEIECEQEFQSIFEKNPAPALIEENAFKSLAKKLHFTTGQVRGIEDVKDTLENKVTSIGRSLGITQLEKATLHRKVTKAPSLLEAKAEIFEGFSSAVKTAILKFNKINEDKDHMSESEKVKALNDIKEQIFLLESEIKKQENIMENATGAIKNWEDEKQQNSTKNFEADIAKKIEQSKVAKEAKKTCEQLIINFEKEENLIELSLLCNS